MNLLINIEIFQEDDVYVALAPKLNVSSFGNNVEDAKNSVKEALEAFLEECARMGTLEDVLQEAGFSKQRDLWEPKKPIFQSVFAFAV